MTYLDWPLSGTSSSNIVPLKSFHVALAAGKASIWHCKITYPLGPARMSVLMARNTGLTIKYKKPGSVLLLTAAEEH